MNDSTTFLQSVSNDSKMSKRKFQKVPSHNSIGKSMMNLMINQRENE